MTDAVAPLYCGQMELLERQIASPNVDGGTGGPNFETAAAAGKRLLSVKELCHQYSIGRTFLFSILKNGELDVVRIGRKTLVPVQSMDAYIARHTVRRVAD